MTESFTASMSCASSRSSGGIQHLAQLLAPLSQGLDLVEGQPMGHALRTAAIGLRIAKRAGLSDQQQGHLFYASLLKDTGTSASASVLFHSLKADEIRIRPDLRTTGWPQGFREGVGLAVASTADGTPLLRRLRTIVRLGLTNRIDSERLTQMRGEYGAAVARKLKMPEAVIEAIVNVEERWDGNGLPSRISGQQIPVAARIISLAQTLEVLRNKPNTEQAMEYADDRRGTWFDPDLVQVAESLSQEQALFEGLDSSTLLKDTIDQLSTAEHVPATEERVDLVCTAFAWVVDAKSPYTLRRSRAVAELATSMGTYFGFNDAEQKVLQRAALLRDLGMLGVPNAILEKPGPLTGAEFTQVMRHPQMTWDILNCIPGFEAVSQLAAAHHEALDGSGYLRGIGAKEIPFPVRILAVADTFQALSSVRPYRPAFTREEVLKILEEEVPSKLDPHCVEAVRGLAQSGAFDQSSDLNALSESIDIA